MAQEEIPCRKGSISSGGEGYYKQFAEAKLLEYKSWFGNEVVDLVDLRKVKPENYVTGRWVRTIKTNKQGNFFKAKARWVL